jgi:hypothetical protein
MARVTQHAGIGRTRSPVRSAPDGVEDMVTLGDASEASLLHNLRRRYYADKIYTGAIASQQKPASPQLHVPRIPCRVGHHVGGMRAHAAARRFGERSRLTSIAHVPALRGNAC